MGPVDHASPVSLRRERSHLDANAYGSRKFLADYYKCISSFVNHNWAVIEKAVGWAALRAWLLVRSLHVSGTLKRAYNIADATRCLWSTSS